MIDIEEIHYTFVPNEQEIKKYFVVETAPSGNSKTKSVYALENGHIESIKIGIDPSPYLETDIIADVIAQSQPLNS